MSTRITAPKRSRFPLVVGVVVVLAAGLGGAWAAGLIDLDKLKSLVAQDTTTARADQPARPAPRQPVRAQPTPPSVSAAEIEPPRDVRVPPAQRAPEPQPQAQLPPPAEPKPVVVGPPVIRPNPVFLRIDRAADSLDRAVRMYHDVAGRGTGCDALARVRTVVDSAVGRYNVAKNESGAQLDDPRAARDRLLYGGADSVEAHFRRAGCPAS